MGHTRYSGCKLWDEDTDDLAFSSSKKVIGMSNFDNKEFFEDYAQHGDWPNIDPTGDEDLLMEHILENINTTPIGQVLKNIASLPEVRRNKVLNVRRQITEGQYDLNDRLDVALDKVLEDLTA